MVFDHDSVYYWQDKGLAKGHKGGFWYPGDTVFYIGYMGVLLYDNT